MNDTRISIMCEDSGFDDCYNVVFTLERNYRSKFKEVFLSTNVPLPPYLIEEENINDANAVKSASVKLLSHIKDIISNSMKTDSHIFTDKEIDSVFEYRELNTIRRFAEIAGVKFDESKFKNRKEFQEYFRKWIKNRCI